MATEFVLPCHLSSIATANSKMDQIVYLKKFYAFGLNIFLPV